MSQPTSQFEQRLQAARSDSAAHAGPLLVRYESWLRILARSQCDARWQAKFDASDVVQQTLLEAHRDFGRFRGQSEPELVAWLRQILSHVLAHELRKYQGTAKRDAGREASLDQRLADTSQRLGDLLAASITSPSGRAMRQEQETQLADCLERLPDDYRKVIMLRHLEGLTHEAIAERMQRSVGAVRMLWVRALAQLREKLGNR